MKKIVFVIILCLLFLPACFDQKTDEVQPEKISGSILDLVKLGKNYRCELTVTEQGQTIVSTTYISGEKARTDSKIQMAAETITSHQILADKIMYSWVEEYPEQAIKMNLDEMPQAEEGETAEMQDNFKTLQADYDYQCYRWSADQSMFEPPADINFIDYTEMLKQIQEQFGNFNMPMPNY